MAEMSQNEIFDGIKAGSEIDGIENWTFPGLIERLRDEIKRQALVAKACKPYLRFFSRNFLDMRKDRYRQVAGWLNGAPMTRDEMIHVAKTLRRIERGELSVEKLKHKAPPALRVRKGPVRAPTGPAPDPNPTGIQRALLNHLIGTVNSILGMLTESKLSPTLVFDSDRMYATAAMKKICRTLGIKASFPEDEGSTGSPLTAKDLRDLGIDKLQ